MKMIISREKKIEHPAKDYTICSGKTGVWFFNVHKTEIHIFALLVWL